MKNSFIVKKKASLAIVDGRVGLDIEKNLKSLGLDVVRTMAHPDLEASVSYHPDLVIHPLEEASILVEDQVFDYYKEKLAPYNISLFRGKTRLGAKYPADIAYNVGRIGTHAVHRQEHMDRDLKSYFQLHNIDIVNVRQGYSKCSLGLLGSNQAITSDRPIYEKLSQLGYEVLLIRPGYIDLPGQAYGFIGGAMGNLNEDKVLLSGRLDGHPDKDLILDFAARANKTLIYLSQDKILDVGTIIVL